MSIAKTWHKRAPELPYAHIKLDGICVEVMRNDSGYLRVLTKTPIDICQQLASCGFMGPIASRFPSGKSVLAELWVPGMPASFVKSAVKNCPQALRLNAFAITRGMDEAAELRELNWQLERWGFQTIDYFVHERAEFDIPELADTYPDVEWLLDNVPKHAEGFVLKAGNLLDLYKLKPVKTIDCVVTGLQDGRGKFLGLVGALHVSVEGHEIARVSGMSDSVREEITEADIGRVVEVRYDYVGSQGRLRFPAFIRWRDDKKPDECTLDQDVELELCIEKRMRTSD